LGLELNSAGQSVAFFRSFSFPDLHTNQPQLSDGIFIFLA